jgi:hypothetical protein
LYRRSRRAHPAHTDINRTDAHPNADDDTDAHPNTRTVPDTDADEHAPPGRPGRE